ELINEYCKFQDEIKTNLTKLRSNTANENEIQIVLERFRRSCCSSQGIDEYFRENIKLKEKCQLLSLFQKKGISLVKESVSPELLPQEHDNTDIYIIYISDELQENERDKWIQQYEYFMKIMKNTKNQSMSSDTTEPEFFLVDYDVHTNIDKSQGVKIHFYRNGTKITDDYYTYQNKNLTESTPVERNQQQQGKEETNGST
ncbi:unnamed protein product, partial [Didymodactylos carnosus]